MSTPLLEARNITRTFGGGGLFLGVGLINLCLGVFFTALKLRSDRANAVAYVLLESESTEEANAL